MRLASLTAIVVLFLTSFSTAAVAQQAIYTLGAGDKIRVTVFGEEDLSGEFEVNGQGGVSLPLIGNVNGLGFSISRLERKIEEMLLEGFLKQPRVSIEVLNYRPFYIMGEVKEPGSYPYVNGMTGLNAVALGGGFTYRAVKKKFTIIRATDKTRTSKKIPPEGIILPGDVVTIEERFF
jgi:polysaccharide export outer membrane protein